MKTFDEWSANWSIDSKPELRDFARNVWNAALEAAGWHPISECPEELKDGRQVLVKGDPDLVRPAVGRWQAHIHGWVDTEGDHCYPTHYMEVPLND